jgi:hypothetical protein
MRNFAAPFLLLLAACGPADFSGHWVGTVTDNAPCTDGSSLQFTKATDYAVTQKGALLTLSGNDICGVWQASAQGGIANVMTHVCPSFVSNGFLITQTLTGGTLTIRGSTLDENISTSFTFSGPSSGSCTGSITGTLTAE